jgi:ribosomal protein L11 methylase PrmA
VPGTVYDLLLGNLYADLVLRLAADPRLPRVVRGPLLLSGIAAPRERAVRAALAAAGWRIAHRLADGWWIGLHAVRVDDPGSRQTVRTDAQGR